MIYLLDANTLINAKNFYYPIDRIPEFWEWLVHQGELGNIKIPLEIYEEFKDKRDQNGDMDELAVWAEQDEVKEALLLNEEANMEAVRRVTYEGYLPDPTDDQIETMGRDPFLISYALLDKENRCIVTSEVSKPKKQGPNRHIPDVCRTLEVNCMDSHKLIRVLDFSTAWKG